MPNILRTELLRYGIALGMAPTERGALFVFTKQQSEAIRIRFSFDGEYAIDGDLKTRTVRGVSRYNHGGSGKNFGLHFIADAEKREYSYLSFLTLLVKSRSSFPRIMSHRLQPNTPPSYRRPLTLSVLLHKHNPIGLFVINGHKDAPYEKVALAIDIAQGLKVGQLTFTVEN